MLLYLYCGLLNSIKRLILDIENNMSISSKKRLELHVGLPKTGSTYMQKMWLSNQTKMLEHATCYPATSSYKHDFIRQCFISGKFIELEKLLTETDATTIILSNESISNDFYWLNHRHISNFSKLIDSMGFELTIHVVLREKGSWLKSYYKQAVINQPCNKFDFYSTALTFNEFKSVRFVNKLLDYKQLLADLELSFGARVIEYNYQHESINSIASSISKSELENTLCANRLNNSLDNEVVEVFRQLNGVISSKKEKYFYAHLISASSNIERLNHVTLGNLSNRFDSGMLSEINMNLTNDIHYQENTGLDLNKEKFVLLVNKMQELVSSFKAPA